MTGWNQRNSICFAHFDNTFC